MARPLKTGLVYFPLDVDFFDDDKIQLIESEFGIKGGYIAVRLLCKIYNEGYYYNWGLDECLLFSKQIGVPKGLVDEVVSGLVRRCFFDKGCFDQFGILTSQGIQKRYISIVKSSKIKRADITEKYDLAKNSEETAKTSEEIKKTSEESTQREGKKIKEISTNVDTKKKETQSQKLIAAKAATQNRKEDFRLSLVPFVDRYGKDMIRAFFDYWTEPNKSFSKMRYETEKTWDLALRLGNWCNRDMKYGKGKSDNSKPTTNIY